MGKRSNIVEAVHLLVREVGRGENGFYWNRTEKCPIVAPARADCPGFYLVDYQERVVEESAASSNTMTTRELLLVIQVFAEVIPPKSPSACLDQLMDPITRVLQGAKLDGLVKRISEVGSRKKYDHKDQLVVSCQMIFKVSYARGSDD